jgi:magnesium transporter
MKRYFSIVDRKLQEGGGPESPVWLVTAPTEEEQKSLVVELKIDEHTLHSALDPDEPARLEYEPDHTAMIFNRPKNYSEKDKFLFKVGSLGLFLFEKRLVIVTVDDVPLIGGKGFNALDSVSDVLLRVLNRAIGHFLEHLKVINMIADDIEKKINSSMENKHLLNLFSLEKSLVYYLNAIAGNDAVLTRLKNSAGRLELSPAPRGVPGGRHHREQRSATAKRRSIPTSLAGLMDARASIVSNNLNILMKTLNLITIVIMVPTLIVSVFSMNVTIPLEKARGGFLGHRGDWPRHVRRRGRCCGGTTSLKPSTKNTNDSTSVPSGRVSLVGAGPGRPDLC